MSYNATPSHFRLTSFWGWHPFLDTYIPTFTFIKPVCYIKAGSFHAKSHERMLSLRAELIWLVLASWWLLTGGLSLPCFLFTATLVARRRVHLYTRLTETPQQAFKSLWNYISSILWTTCKWNLSQCCWKCHLSPPCLPSGSVAGRASQIHLYIHLTWMLFTWIAMQCRLKAIECH